MSGTPTERLYLADPWLWTFDATVVGHAQRRGRAAVVLDRTAFYPEGGGQLADRGTLGGAAVVDVQVDDGGTIYHVIDGDPPPLGARVRGEVDGRRRRAHMALHTGQHMLSRALVDVAAAPTVSSRLGEGGCTVDVAVSRLADRDVAAAVERVHEVVDADVEVRAWVPPPEELARLPLRRAPKVARDVRVVAIGDFDVSPCGGTHCTRTGQVGVVCVDRVEAYKGMTRIHFDAGPRARDRIARHALALRAIGRALSCGPDEVSDAVDRLRADLADARAALCDLRLRAAAEVAERLIAATPPPGWVVAVVDGDVAAMRAIAKRIADAGRACALAVVDGDGMRILAAAGEGIAADCGALIRAVCARAGGRGGGRPAHAEGRLPAIADWPGLVRDVQSH
ncbi:MAG: alanyl-tRNA editing protein [Deltaproteobacteria bacterium]|nr:MAG: alanyl-tRNA editing protein [Deltaproteobacteria bacterium]